MEQSAAGTSNASSSELPSSHPSAAAGAGDGSAAVESAGSTGPAGSGGRLVLTSPEGFLFSNEAISTVFARLDETWEARDRERCK